MQVTAGSAMHPGRRARPSRPSEDAIRETMAPVDSLHGPEDIATLYDTYGGLALALANGIVGDMAAAEDVVHDALLSMWRSRDRHDPLRESPRSWMFRAVRNGAIDRARRANRQLVVMTPEPAQPATAEIANAEPVAGAADLRSAMETLPAAQATVLELAYFHGHTQTEISRLMGTSADTVKAWTRLALRALSPRSQSSPAA